MKYKVAALQSGTFTPEDTYESYMEKQVELLRRCVREEHPYLALYSETMTGAYFCGVRDAKYFANAETMDGKTVTMFVSLAKELEVHICFSMYEKASEYGQTCYYNTLVLVSPTRGIIGKYRKNHIPWTVNEETSCYEKFYFKPGQGFPVYKLDNGSTVGCLLCYDRSFPESWRMYGLQNVEVVCMAACTWGYRGKLFLPELAIRAQETGAYVIATNRAGEERVEGETRVRHHFGHSGILDCEGEIMASLSEEPWAYVTAEINTEKTYTAHGTMRVRDRRPELYGLLTAQGAMLGAPAYNPAVDEFM